jgi:hypothetical protein
MADFKQIGIDLDVNRAIESNRRSFAETENDILRRLLLRDAEATPLPSIGPDIESQVTRARGRWTVVRGANRRAAQNLKEAYRTALLVLHEEFPDFLEKFADEQARSRRFIAKSPADLYLRSPALARSHAKPLADGWFFDTNLSTDQVSRRVRIAARLCGLRYGKDLMLLNNMEQI